MLVNVDLDRMSVSKQIEVIGSMNDPRQLDKASYSVQSGVRRAVCLNPYTRTRTIRRLAKTDPHIKIREIAYEILDKRKKANEQRRKRRKS